MDFLCPEDKPFLCGSKRTEPFCQSTRMDPLLRGCELPIPTCLSFPLSKELKTQAGFEDLQSFYPGMGELISLKKAPEEDLWLDHRYRVVSVLSSETTTTSGRVSLRVERNCETSGVEVQDVSGFRKLTHLLDPVRWLQGKYSLPKHPWLPWHQDSWEAAWTKLQDPMNQAYVEATAAYAFSRIREADLSPHFHLFYGALCGKADAYAYNITDSYMSYRNARWFWNGQEKKLFSLRFDDALPDEVKEALLHQPEELEDSSSESERSEEELEDMDCSSLHSGSLHSASGSAFESASEEETSEEPDEMEDSEDEELEIFAEVKNFPVLMMFSEASKGTMDELLDSYEEVGAKPGTPEWDRIWTAWTFQVIAALCVGQTLLGFTHNDLHSNNVVWSPTEKPFLYYTLRDGTTFKVPTFGKIFRLIDFGRSIYKINSHEFFSDDFKPGNDAAEQFNYGALFDPSQPEVYPNPSFDLCRFTVSLFESLFPESPKAKKGGKVLSQEPDLTIYETESELYNLMWSWLICDDGHNVLMDPDGSERYPDFDLYKVITQEVHGAIPSEQVKKPLFAQFRVKDTGGQKAYSLFC